MVTVRQLLWMPVVVSPTVLASCVQREWPIPAEGWIVTADLDGDGQDELVDVPVSCSYAFEPPPKGQSPAEVDGRVLNGFSCTGDDVTLTLDVATTGADDSCGCVGAIYAPDEPPCDRVAACLLCPSGDCSPCELDIPPGSNFWFRQEAVAMPECGSSTPAVDFVAGIAW